MRENYSASQEAISQRRPTSHMARRARRASCRGGAPTRIPETSAAVDALTRGATLESARRSRFLRRTAADSGSALALAADPFREVTSRKLYAPRLTNTTGAQ
jgi:hypothetical protein